MERAVTIEFDCLPLRSLSRRDVPIDASPKYQAFCERVLAALARHGAHNTYYLYNTRCVFQLTNHPEKGMLEFQFEGTIFTDAADLKSDSCDLHVKLVRETCEWLTEPVVQWFHECVRHAVLIEFDLYIAAGDLAKTIERMERLKAETEAQGGFLGMYL